MTRNHNYKLDKIKKIKQAKIVDLVIETCIKAQVDDSDESKAYKLCDMISQKYGLHSIAIEMLFWIMEYQGYLTAITIDDESSSVDRYEPTTKGISLYFNGGLAGKIRSKQNKRRLVRLAQAASIIVGAYYFIEILLAIQKAVCR